MAEIKTPIGIFADINGKPLDDGYIFIGQAGLDAESNQIDVFWDAEFTVPATQPIRTIAGYPSNAGVPGRIYVEASDYSIVTKNKRQTPVKSTNSNNADLTGFFTKLEGTLSLGQTTISTDREGGDPGGALLPDDQKVFLRHNPRIDISGGIGWTITDNYTLTLVGSPAGGETFSVEQNADDATGYATFASLAEAVASTKLQVGQRGRFIGYYDGWAATADVPKGGNEFEVVPAGTGTPDGGSFVDCTGITGQLKMLFIDGRITVERFGAVADHERGVTTGTDNYTAFNNCALYALSNKEYWIVPKREFMFRVGSKLTIDLTNNIDEYLGGLKCYGEIFSSVISDFAIHVKGKQIDGEYQNRYPIKGLRLFSDYTSRGIWLERLDHEGSEDWYIEGVNAPWVRLTNLRETAPRQVVMKYCDETAGQFGIEFFENDAVLPNVGTMDATNLVNFDSWFAVYCGGNYIGVKDTNTANNVRSVIFANSVLHYLDFDPAGTPITRNSADTLIKLDTPCQIVWSGGLIRKGVGTSGNSIDVSNEARLKLINGAELSGEGTGLNYISNSNSKNHVIVGEDVLFNGHNGTIYTGLEPIFLNSMPNKCGNADLLTEKFDDAAGCAGFETSNGTLTRNGDKSATLTATAAGGFAAAKFYDLGGAGIITASAEIKSSNTNHNITVFAFDALDAVIGGPFSTSPTSGSDSYEMLSITVELPANTAYCEIRIGNSLQNTEAVSFRKPRFVKGRSISAYSDTDYNVVMKKHSLGAVGVDSTVNGNTTVQNEIFQFSVTPSFGSYQYWLANQSTKNQINLSVTADTDGISDAAFYIVAHVL